MKPGIILMLAFLAALLLPGLAGAPSCLNSSWSRETIAIDGSGKTIDTYCKFGCDSARGFCNSYGGEPGTAIPLEMFLFFEGVTIILLMVTLLGEDEMPKIMLSLLCIILFLVLGMLSTNVLVSGTPSVFLWLAWLNWGLGGVSLVIFLYSVFMNTKETTEEVVG